MSKPAGSEFSPLRASIARAIALSPCAKMSMTQLLQIHARPVRMARLRGRVLPYLLSLPALLVCVEIGRAHV